jgi:hypothetical protein
LITVHLQQMPSWRPGALVTEAIHNFFDYKAELARREVRQSGTRAASAS